MLTGIIKRIVVICKECHSAADAGNNYSVLNRISTALLLSVVYIHTLPQL